MQDASLINELTRLVGKRCILTRARATRFYRTGFRSGAGAALAVVFPSTLVMQWQVLQLCVDAGAVIIMQAANTGLTEGSSPSGDDYDRPVIIINGKYLKKLILLNNGQQVIACPGVALHAVEKALAPLAREPHSVIGSSCIGASVIGGIANNSGGALVQRGPAYTQLALFARVTESGELALVNHLGIALGDDPVTILSRLENQDFDTGDVEFPAQLQASDRDYIERVRDIEAETPARYNADPRCLYEASGCAGKVAVFAVRVDTFARPRREQTFYIATHNPAQLTALRRAILSGFQNTPILGEYIHRDAFDLAETYGKDIFISINRLGTTAMPKMFAFKGYCTSVLNSIPWLPKDLPDKVMYWSSHLFPQQLPKKLLQLRDTYEHHLIIKMGDEGIAELHNLLQQQFVDSASGEFLVCGAEESQKALLHRFAVAGAAIRYYQMHSRKVEDIVALDIALPRNTTDWFEQLPESLSQKLVKSIYYGHFFCHVFHQDYLVKKGHSPAEVKRELLAFQEQRGAKFPAEHNVGHLYEAAPELKQFYQSLDPTNTFNPGIGKMSKHRAYGCC